jgi:hypothetical protein
MQEKKSDKWYIPLLCHCQTHTQEFLDNGITCAAPSIHLRYDTILLSFLNTQVGTEEEILCHHHDCRTITITPVKYIILPKASNNGPIPGLTVSSCKGAILKGTVCNNT